MRVYLAGSIFYAGDVYRNTDWAARIRAAIPSIDLYNPLEADFNGPEGKKRFALDYDGKKLFQQRETQRLNVQTDKWEFAKQHQLYEDVTEYVRKSFENALDMNSYAKGLVMVMFQKLASSSTAAVLSAMRNRYKRLLEGEDPDELEDRHSLRRGC